MSLHNSHGFQYVKQLQINNESLRLEINRLKDLLEKSEDMRKKQKEVIKFIEDQLKECRKNYKAQKAISEATKKGMKWNEEIKNGQQR